MKQDQVQVPPVAEGVAGDPRHRSHPRAGMPDGSRLHVVIPALI